MADDGKDEAVAPPRPRMKPILLYEELVLGGVTTTGVKYTCVDVCARFLACGASNGSVYVFARSQKKQATSNVQFRLLKMIAPPSSASERHPVASLSFCPSQRYLVVGTAKGAVYAISLVDPARIGEKIEFSHALHVGFSVNAFLWDADGSRVFSACAGGTVAQTSIRAGMSVLFGNTTTEFLLKEDTAIVQLDVVTTASPARDYLLVSSQTRVLILNLAATDANGVVQVGSKLRQGNYGACFYLDDDEKDYRVFSTRPGRRVWVGDPSTGTVSSTLKFSLTKPPETFFQGPHLPPHEPISVKSLNLSKVHVFKYIHESMDFTPEAPQLLSWFPGTSALFFIDPVGLELVEWHVDLGEIHDLKVLDASVFAVLHGDPGRVAIVRACAAVEFLELAVSNDVAKSIDLVVKYSIQDLALLLNLQCKWTEHIKQHPDDASLVPNATLQALEGLIEIAATLLEEQTKAPEADIQPPHIVFKQRREMPAISSPKAGASIETELRFALPSAAATSYGQLNLAPSLVVAETGASRSRVVEIPDLSAQDKVVDEAWRAAHLPAPSEAINYKPPTLFGETLDVLDFESHLTNATSSLVSLLPDMSFLRRDSTSDFIDEESFPPLDVPAHVAPSVVADPSLALRIVMAVETTTSDEDAALIVPEAVQLTEPSACIDLDSEAEVVLEAISIDLWASQLQVQAALPWLKELEATPLPEPPTSGSSSGDDATTLPLIESPQKLMARARSLSETKRSLIQRTVKRQMGVYPAAHVDWKWHVGGAMQQSPEIAPILARPLPDVEAEFAARVADADQHQKLMLWPTVHLTRSAACLVNHLVHQGDLARATQLLRQWLGTFDPSLDVAVIEKRKAIELIKRSKMAAPAPIEEELPLTRHDWRLVRSLVSLYFLLHADVPLSIEPATAPFVLDNRTRMDDFGLSLLVSVPLTPSPSPKLQPFLTKYGNYVHLEMAAQVCSALEHAAGLETVLNLAIASESLAQACDDLLMAVAEKQALDLSQYTSLCVCLHVLNVLLKKAPAAAIAWCVERYPCVTPWNVQTALFGSQFALSSTAPGNNTYFAYLSALLSSAHDGVGRRSTLVKHWLVLFFNQSHADDADVALLLTILGAPDTFAFDRAVAWDLCMQHDMWDGVFQLVLNAIAQPSSRRAGTSELRTLVYTMLQSDTPSRLAMLAGLFERIAVLPNPTPLLHCVLEEMEAFCQLTQKDVAFVPLLHAMLDACGVTLGMELLAAYPTLIAIAPLELYQAVVAAQSLHQRQLQEVGRMLEGIDTYVWSCSRRHHLAFPPQVEALFRIESGFYDTWDTGMPDYTPYCAKDDAADTKLLHRSYESRNSDWGGDIQLHDSQCAVCDLPLVYLQEDGKTMEAILLSCGHAYHDGCLPDRTCPLCLYAHFRFHSIDA